MGIDGGSGGSIVLSTLLMGLIDTKDGSPCWVESYYGLPLRPLTRLFTSCLFAVSLSGCISNGVVTDCVLDSPLISDLPGLRLERLLAVPRRNSERESAVWNYLHAAGCSTLMRQPVPYRKVNNIICTINGESDEEILIAAHYDRFGTGTGVADNWTGIVVLTALADYYGQSKPIHTLRLVAFADEEKELRGSRYYVKELKSSGGQLPRLMINIDTVGLIPLRVDRRSAKKLQCVAISAAESLGIELTRVRLDETTGDWQSFRRAGVDTLNFHSLNKPMIAMLHTYRDRRDLVDDDQFISAYMVIANTISALDHGVDLTISP